jgi:hypothetical protein
MTRSTIAARTLAWGLAISTLLGGAACLYAGGFFNNRSVGGVAITPEGVLEAPTEQDERELEQVREQLKLDVPAALEEFTELRAVSLKGIEAAIAKAHTENKPVPADVVNLAGLQRVRYVFVYPERNDIVLVGPHDQSARADARRPTGRSAERRVVAG